MKNVLLTASAALAVAGIACFTSALADKTLTPLQVANRAALGLLLPHVAVAPLYGAKQIADAQA